MKQGMKKILVLICAATVVCPAPLQTLARPSSSFVNLAPRHSETLPDELAADWVASQIQGMLRRDGKVIQADLDRIPDKLAAKMQYNPWDVKFEWIWANPAVPSFEFVLGGGLYTVRFTSQDPSWKYEIDIFRLDKFLETSRAPLLKTAAAEDALGIPERHIPTGYKPPSFEEEQDRLLAISIEELHAEVMAFSDQTTALRSRGEMEWYESKRSHFVSWCERLLAVFPEPLPNAPADRETARRSLETARDLLRDKKNYGASLASLVKARRHIYKEGKLLQENRALEMRYSPQTLAQERADSEALITMGRFLVAGEGPVTIVANFWKRGAAPLEGSSQLVKSQTLVHYASQRDRIMALVATLGSIQETQGLFKLYLQKIEIFKKIAAMFWEESEMNRILAMPRDQFQREAAAQLREVQAEDDAEKITQIIQSRLQDLSSAMLSAHKAMEVVSIREAALRVRHYTEDLEHHSRRLERLKVEAGHPYKLRPDEKLREQIKESEKIVAHHPAKIAELQTAIFLAKERIQQLEAQEKEKGALDPQRFLQHRAVAGWHFYHFLISLRARREEWRVRGRDHLVRAFHFLFPEFDQNTLPKKQKVSATPPKRPKKEKPKKEKPPKRIYQVIQLMDPQWMPELEAVKEPRYREAQRAFNEAYKAFVKTLYDQDSQTAQTREELQDQREEFFRRVIRGLKLKGLLNQLKVGMAQSEPDLRALWRVARKMKRQLMVKDKDEEKESQPLQGVPQSQVSPSDFKDNENPLTPHVEALERHLITLGAWYQNDSRRLAMKIFDELIAIFPPVSTIQPEDYPAITPKKIAKMREIQSSIPKWLEQIRHDPSHIGSRILPKMNELFRQFNHLATLLQLRDAGSFPTRLIEPYGAFHRYLHQIRSEEDPRARFNLEKLPPLKETKTWKKIENEVAALEALLEPPVAVKASSPLIKKSAVKPVKVAAFNITFHEIRGEKRVRVAIEEQTRNPEMPLFKGVVADSPKASEIQDKLREALTKIFIHSLADEEGWKRRELIKKIEVYSGLDKMADFSGGVIQLDEDLFGNKDKGIPFDGGLLVLELQLKLDHLAAIRDRRGVPATPAQLALEKLRFLLLYIQRFLDQPPEIQRTQIRMLHLHSQELDQGRFYKILAQARILRQRMGARQTLTLLDTLTKQNLIPYLLNHYPEILTCGLKMLDAERVPIVEELGHPSELLQWNTRSRGSKTLRLSSANINDVRRFYQDEDAETRKDWSRNVALALKQMHIRESKKILLKVADRSGEVLAWAVVACTRNASPIFPEEGEEKITRLVVTDFDVKKSEDGADQVLAPLLLNVARLIPIWKASPFIQVRLAQDQFGLQRRIPHQKIIPRSQFPAEDYLDEDVAILGREREQPREIFVDALQLRTQYGLQFPDSSREANFFAMLRGLLADPGRFVATRGWIYEADPEGWKFTLGNWRPSQKAAPLLFLQGAKPRERIADLLGFLKSGDPQSVILAENKIWIVEKEAQNLMQMPLIEELGIEKYLGPLQNLFSRFNVYDPQTWEEIKSRMAEEFLEAALERLEGEKEKGLDEAQYAKLLSWIAGARIRVVDTAAKPEWIEEDILSHMAEELPEERRASYAVDLLESLKKAVTMLANEAQDVQKAGRKVGDALKDLQTRLDRMKRRKRGNNQVLDRVLQDLEAVRQWAYILDPRYQEVPSPLRNLWEVLKPLGERSEFENEAVRKVSRIRSLMESAHHFLISPETQREIETTLSEIQTRIEIFWVLIKSEQPDSAPPLQPANEEALAVAI